MVNGKCVMGFVKFIDFISLRVLFRNDKKNYTKQTAIIYNYTFIYFLATTTTTTTTTEETCGGTFWMDPDKSTGVKMFNSPRLRVIPNFFIYGFLKSL